MYPRFVTAILLSAFMGCGSSTEPPIERDADAPLQTERLRYVLHADGSELRTTIVFTYTNSTGGPLAFENCRGSHPPFLEKLESGGWVGGWYAFEAECLSPPIVLASHAFWFVDLWHSALVS